MKLLDFKRIVARVGLVGMVGILGGCGVSSTGQQSIFVVGCIPERFELLEGVSWDEVGVTRIIAIDNNFRPPIFHFVRGKAYIIDVENVDGSANNIWAPDFLKQGVALHSIQIGTSQPANGCINGVHIKPKSKIRIKFVAANEGRYEIFNTVAPFIPGQITGGVFYVDPPRPGIPEN
ncbi:MAG: hypothetical protein OEW37_09465 [Rhodospirillaceae bacterium]|nr:hypothetical protein [Rhodospirillaceae bacterium]